MPVILLRRAVIDETIDCLVADKGATVVSRRPAGDLLGRQSHRKALPDQISQVRLARQLEATIPPAPTVGQTLRASRIMATAPRPPRLAVAPQFPTDRRRAAIQRPRDRAQRFAVCSQTANLNPLGQAKLLVPSSHRNTILRCCTCSVNSGYPWQGWTPASAGEALAERDQPSEFGWAALPSCPLALARGLGKLRSLFDRTIDSRTFGGIMSETVRYERRGDIAVITLDNPPVNALSSSVRQGLADSLAQGLTDDAVKAFVLIGAGRTYIAGADIREFGKPMTGPGLQQLITDYENSPKPIVVAIHTTPLGGGLEVALGCHYRVAVASAQLGLPEVKLGILPGAGGTQRMPRVIGVKAALDMITSGDTIPAAKAKGIGLVDDIVEGDLLEGAIKFAETVAIPGGTKGRQISRNNDKLGDASPAFFAEARKSVAAKARGQIAPVKIVDALEAAAISLML